MSQMSGNPMGRPGRASNNIYTVLAFVALAALLIGIIFIWAYGNRLFDSTNPFEVERIGSVVKMTASDLA